MEQNIQEKITQQSEECKKPLSFYLSNCWRSHYFYNTFCQKSSFNQFDIDEFSTDHPTIRKKDNSYLKEKIYNRIFERKRDF